MSGRAATINVIPGKYALSVGRADMPAPKGWQWVALGDIARLESGHTPSREHPEYWDGGIAWIGIKDARTHHGSVIAETFQTITQAGIDNSAARLLPAETVCLSRTASVGYVVVMGREMATSQDFVNWVCGPAIDPHFLKQLLIAENDSLFRFGKGSTHTTIYYPEVKAFHVCLPPLNEQKRIVAKVEELTARSRRAKETLDAVPPLLDQLRQSILAAAFRGDLTADWRTKNPNPEHADKLLASIREERRSRWESAELAKMAARGRHPADDRWKERYVEPLPPESDALWTLPAGWTWASVDDLSFSVDYGSSAKTEDEPDGVPVLRMGNIFEGYLRLEELKYLPNQHDEFPDLLLNKGDLLFNRTNSVELVGKTAVYNGSPSPCSFASYLIRVQLCCGYEPQLLSNYINSAFGRAWVNSVAAQQVGQANVNGTKLRGLTVPVPPSLEQGEILRLLTSTLGAIRDNTNRVESELEALHRLDRAILSKAFRGQLVAQDPDDESASVLLERIRAARASGDPSESPVGRQSRKADAGAKGSKNGGSDNSVTPIQPESVRAASKDLSDCEHQTLVDEAIAALWTLGPLDKEEAVRRVADHLRQARYVQFERLRTDGPLFRQVLDTIESAVKAGRLDRPKRGHVRACKADAAIYTAADWRHALVASLGTEPTDRDETIRGAAEWARDNLGLEFTRLRSDGHIVEGLRSAINSAIRRGDVIRHDATHISRAGAVQPALLLKGRSA